MTKFKHLRPGHVNLERNCDVLAIYATQLLPGTGQLPQRWQYKNPENFRSKYVDELGPILWAKTASYHMLMFEEHYVFRLWTDSSKTILVDVCDELAFALKDFFDILEVPKSTFRKTKPFTKRIKITKKRDVKILMLQTIMTFRLGITNG